MLTFLSDIKREIDSKVNISHDEYGCVVHVSHRDMGMCISNAHHSQPDQEWRRATHVRWVKIQRSTGTKKQGRQLSRKQKVRVCKVPTWSVRRCSSHEYMLVPVYLRWGSQEGSTSLCRRSAGDGLQGVLEQGSGRQGERCRSWLHNVIATCWGKIRKADSDDFKMGICHI